MFADSLNLGLPPAGSAAMASAFTTLKSSLCIYNNEIIIATAESLGDADANLKHLGQCLTYSRSSVPSQ